jgi:lipooligosaccharide transport system ATP-binding protein
VPGKGLTWLNVSAIVLSVQEHGDNVLVKAQNLVKRFDDLTAVDDISFEIRTGEVIGFLGPNGAGKTTTIRMLICTSPLSAGSLTVFGLDVTKSPRQIKAQLGVVPQDNNYDPDLTVLRNLLTYGRYYGLNPKDTARRARELLDFVQLTEKANDTVEELSGGMKRRLIFARGLINQPRLLVLDEPTTGLDPQARRLIWQRLRELKHSGVTIVITTHYMDEAEQVCDRVLVMDKGKIIAEGTPRGLIEQHAGKEVLEVMPEEPADTRLAELLRACPDHQQVGDRYEVFDTDCPGMLETIRSQVKLNSYVIRRATLEDVFIRLTGRELRE